MNAKVVHYSRIEAKEVAEKGASKARIRVLIGVEDGAENFIMRMFELEPGGNTPLHKHPWEHEIFILEGEGLVKIGDREYNVSDGYVIYIPPNIEHTIINRGSRLLRFLCLIPKI